MSVCFSTISYFDTFDAFPPDVGLFGTDVTTDLVNGVNLIIDGHVIWGICMVALPFLPAAIAMVGAVPLGVMGVLDVNFGCCLAVCLCSCLSPILYIPAVLICTAVYILYILISGCVKFLFPDMESISEADLDKNVGYGLKLKDFKEIPNMLRTAEVTTESYPQSILGKHKGCNLQESIRKFLTMAEGHSSYG